jgi:radical SAM superfamily enzyme YgiQ (UPF0313 family)
MRLPYPLGEPVPKPHIVFINPTCPTDFLNTSVINEAMGKSAFFPSLSLLTVAAITPKDDFTVSFYDEYLGTTVEQAFAQQGQGSVDKAAAELCRADIFAMTCFDTNRERAYELCRWLKSRGKFVVLGGPHATHHHKMVAETQAFDAIFAGDAERIWPKFLADWTAGKAERVYVEADKLELDLTPVARWDLCDAPKYLTAVIQTSRGCPITCDFCDASVLYGNKVRVKPADTVMKELDIVYHAGFQSVLIGDDNFTAKRQYAKDLLRRIAAWRKDKDPMFVLAAQLSIDIAKDDELLELMARAGLVFAYVGIESSSLEALAHANKKQNLKSDIRTDVDKIHSYGINVMSGLIVGFDTDGPDIFRRHVDFCEALALPCCNSYLLTAPQGTPLRARLEKEGRIDGDYALGELSRTNIIPKRMSQKDLYAGYHWMTTQLFGYEGFGRRLRKKFRLFRNRGIKPEGTATWKTRLRNYKLAARIATFTLTHPWAAKELAHLLRYAVPAMAEHPDAVADIFQDLMVFIRFKAYYEQIGAFRKELLTTPAPETWIKEIKPDEMPIADPKLVQIGVSSSAN